MTIRPWGRGLLPIVALVLVLAQRTAALAFECHPPRAADTLTYSAGRIRDGTSASTYVRAARAILHKDEIPYVEYPNESAAYVEVKSSVSGTHFARIGWRVQRINEMRYFTQYTSGATIFTNEFQIDPFDEVAVKVRWAGTNPDNGREKFTFWAGISHTINDLYGNPELDWRPHDGLIAGRTESRESQFPGRPANKMEMESTQAWVNHEWVGFRTVPLIGWSLASWAIFNDVANQPQHFRLWDGGC